MLLCSETYQYFNLPFCTPKEGKSYKTEGLGEVSWEGAVHGGTLSCDPSYRVPLEHAFQLDACMQPSVCPVSPRDVWRCAAGGSSGRGRRQGSTSTSGGAACAGAGGRPAGDDALQHQVPGGQGERDPVQSRADGRGPQEVPQRRQEGLLLPGGGASALSWPILACMQHHSALPTNGAWPAARPAGARATLPALCCPRTGHGLPHALPPRPPCRSVQLWDLPSRAAWHVPAHQSVHARSRPGGPEHA